MRLGREQRRISSQHRQLDTLYALLVRAIDEGDPSQVDAAFTRFEGALDAHFSLEDGFYFPALHGQRPDLDEQLDQLSAGHALLRGELAEIGNILRRDPALAAGRLDAFVTALARHEGVEEGLLSQLQGS